MLDSTVKALLESGFITQEQLQIALEEQAVSQESITEILINNGFATQETINEILDIKVDSKKQKVNYKKIDIPEEVLKILPFNVIKNDKVFPIEQKGNRYVIGMVDIDDLLARDSISLILGRNNSIERVKLNKEDYDFLCKKYNQFFSGENNEQKKNSKSFKQESKYISNIKKLLPEEGKTLEVIQLIFNKAFRKKATQISIEPYLHHFKIRFKVNNVFHEDCRFEKKYYLNFLNKLKELSSLRSEENNQSYYGNFTLKNTKKDNSEISFTLNSIKTINGDKLIIRPCYPIPKINKLLNNPEVYEYVNKVVSNNRGVLLVIGGAGVGKSTTLYSLLQHKVSEQLQLMTIEDPVKYIFEDNIPQIQQKYDKLQPNVLMHEVARHNPDVLMVQEIKNKDWACFIEELPLSEMLILTSLRAYNILSGLQLLKRMDIKHYSALRCIINQKIIKKLCNNCKEVHLPSSVEENYLQNETGNIFQLYKANHYGCEECTAGYSGLQGIFEVIKVSRDLVNTLNKEDFSWQDIGKIISASALVNFKDYMTKLLKEGLMSLDDFRKISGSNY